MHWHSKSSYPFQIQEKTGLCFTVFLSILWNFSEKLLQKTTTQLTFIYSKSTIEKLKKSVECVQS